MQTQKPVFKWVVETWDDEAERYQPLAKHTRYPRFEQKRQITNNSPNYRTRRIQPGEDVSQIPTLVERLKTF